MLQFDATAAMTMPRFLTFANGVKLAQAGCEPQGNQQGVTDGALVNKHQDSVEHTSHTMIQLEGI